MNCHSVFVLYSSQACCNNMWTPVCWQFTWTMCRRDLPSVKVDSHIILAIVRTSNAASPVIYRGTQAEAWIKMRQNVLECVSQMLCRLCWMIPSLSSSATFSGLKNVWIVSSCAQCCLTEFLSTRKINFKHLMASWVGVEVNLIEVNLP